jgi:hypothetical protein
MQDIKAKVLRRIRTNLRENKSGKPTFEGFMDLKILVFLSWNIFYHAITSIYWDFVVKPKPV